MYNNLYLRYISSKTSIKEWQIEHCIQLLDDGATVPFISRYRKEATGNLDEVQISEIKFYYLKFSELDKRKEAVIKSITDQAKLTPELEKSIKECVEIQDLEDIYLPYKPKRRTKASIAKENGLEPLAQKMLSLQVDNLDSLARGYINDKVKTIDDVLQGARDIIAENIAERQEIRSELRGYFVRNAMIQSKVMKGKDEEGEKFVNYYDFSENLSRIPAHRLLAMLRGLDEGILTVKLNVDSVIPKK
jgi:Transcriptional accessory protein